MPAGSPWLTRPPALAALPAGTVLWRVYDARFDPLGANPRSTARLALVGTHAMFYAADTLGGALWEVALRYVRPDAAQHVHIRPDQLLGLCAVQVRLQRDVPLLALGLPGLRALFDIDSPEALAVRDLLYDPVHAHTHGPARELHDDLRAYGVPDMPVLSYPSKQLHNATVYLAYAPPMQPDWWALASAPIALDDPATGHPLLQAELARHGFTWTPLATPATPPGPP